MSELEWSSPSTESSRGPLLHSTQITLQVYTTSSQCPDGPDTCEGTKRNWGTAPPPERLLMSPERCSTFERRTG